MPKISKKNTLENQKSEKEEKGFIVDIVPLTKIPLTRNQSFSYLSKAELAPGTLVQIPLFRRKVEGVVLSSRKDFERLGNIELKPVEKILEENFLDQKQIELAQFISSYYFASLGIVMKMFVPKKTKSRNKKQDTCLSGRQARYKIQKNIVLTKEQRVAVKNITNDFSKFKIQNSKFLLFGPSGAGKTEVYIHSILKIREKNPQAQFLILVPEQTLTPQALERYGAYFKPEEIVTLSSNLSKGQFYSNWQKIKSGEARVIIGTRMAIAAPFKKLGLIVIDEEQDISFKQWDMSPRYDARQAAEKLSEIHQCPIVFGTATPRIETYHRAINQEINLLTLPPLKLLNTKYQILNTVLVDMRKEKWRDFATNKPGNFSPLSRKLQAEIEYALKYKQQVILFINRQGMSSFSICTKCKAVLKCPKCDRALVYDNKGNYRCIHCSYHTSIIPECPHCQGIDFKNVGLGTQKVEKEIQNIFSSARVARLDSQVVRDPKAAEKIYQDFSRKEIDILIGTQMISKGWDLPTLSLVGIIDTDNLLTIPDFSAQERFFQHIVQLSGRVARPGAKYPGVVLIQTYQPENKILKIAAERDYKQFFELESKEREGLRLPPFGKLIKLIFQDYSPKRTDAEANRVYKTLESISEIRVSEPQDAYVSKIRGRYRKQIVIKYKNKLPAELEETLRKLGQGWIIDVDPISII